MKNEEANLNILAHRRYLQAEEDQKVTSLYEYV
jgi:hypothetical protein